MTTNSKPKPVFLVTCAVPKPRAKGRALWNPFSLRRLSRFAPFPPIGKENVGAGTVSKSVSESVSKAERLILQNSDANRLNTGVNQLLWF